MANMKDAGWERDYDWEEVTQVENQKTKYINKHHN